MSDLNNQNITNENSLSEEGFDIKKGQKKASKKIVIVACIVVALLIVGVVYIMSLKKDKTKVTLGQYKGLTYTAIDTSVSDDEVMLDINRTLESKISYTKLDDRQGTKTKVGDVVNCSYKAVLDGVSLEDATGNFTIGAGEFDSFEKAITDQVIGESVEVTARIPDDYTGNESLEKAKGKEVSFDVKINFVSEKNVPELNDEFVKELTSGQCNTVAEYKDYIKNKIETKRRDDAETEIIKELTDKIIKSSKFENIDGQVKEYYDTMYSTYEAAAKHYELSMEEYTMQFHEVGLKEFEEKLRETMADLVKEQLVLKEIVKEEKLKISDEKYKEYMSQYLTEYSYDNEKDFIDYYGKESIEESMLYDYAIEFVINNAKAK